MKTTSIILALVLASAMSAFAAQTSVTGILTDDMCTKKHMMPGKSNADCVRDCLKHGAKFVVVSQGKAVQVKARPEQLAELAGRKVTVTGDMKNGVLNAASMVAAE